jgi:leader peptidase (prepilin peptidase) / N-methyltransferase
MISVAWFSLLLAAILILISLIDIRQHRIPDLSNVALGLGGILFWCITDIEKLVPQLATGAAVAVGLWIIRRVHSQLTGRIGLGLGDVKMGGAAAVWINPLLLPMFLFVSSLTGLVFALAKGRVAYQERVAFGPFLAIGLMSSWLVENMP